jgi:hypothetical protein
MSADQSANSGAGLKIFGILVIIAGAIFYAAAGDVEENPIALVGAVIMILGLLVHFRGRKQAAKARAAAPQSVLNSAGAHVLYLRSFRTDASSSAKVLASGLSTEEEQLADALRPFGQLIAIGKPGEPLPLPGAARMYASDAEWKDILLDRMQSASLVVIRASTRRGLLWEVEQAIHLLPPQNVVFFILDMTMTNYHQFAARVHEDLALSLPDIPAFSLLQAVVDYRQNPSKAQSGFIYFPTDWTPVFIPLPATVVRIGYNDQRASFNAALRPIFELHGVPWQSLGRFQS